MNENDRLALVSYSDDARLNFDLEDMTHENKKKAIKAMEQLIDDGRTNLWGGLECALDVLK